MPREPAWAGTLDTIGRVVGSTVASLPPTIVLCVLFARWVPMAEASAATVSILLLLPLWACAMAGCLLVRTARRLWLGALGVTLVLCLLAWVSGPMP